LDVTSARRAWLPRRYALDVRHALLLITGLFFFVIILYPLGHVLYRSLVSNGLLSLANYRAVFLTPANYRALWNSIWVSTCSTVIAMAVGTLLALLVVRTDIPCKSFLKILLLLPYGIPPFIGAIAWTQLFGPAGYISKLYTALTGAGQVPWNVYSPGGVVLVLAVYQFPVVFITVSGALGRIDTTLEEAARIAGAGLVRTMWDITVPLVTPAILAGSLLAFVGCISNFGIPALLGFRSRFFVLTTRIYSALSIPNIPLATAMSVVLTGVSAAALVFQRRLEKGQQKYTLIAGKSVNPQTINLRGWRMPVLMATISIAFFLSVTPIVSMLITSVLNYWGAPLSLASMTLDHYKYIARLDMVRRAFANSLFLGIASATITMAVGTFVSYMSVRGKLRSAAILDLLGTVPYALPCTVIAIAMILTWSRGPVVLYGTIWVMLAAYLVRYMPFSIRTTNATLKQVHPSLEEAARVSGAGWLQGMRDVVLPLTKPGLIAGWILVFMPAFRELTMSILLWSQGTETIGVAIYNMQDAGYTQIAAALSTIVLLVILAGNILVRRLSRGRIGL